VELVERHVQVVDVVEGERGEGSVEQAFIFHRLEGRPPEDRSFGRVRIDGDDVVAVRREHPRQLAAPTADLEDPRRRGGNSARASTWRSTGQS
jgi:hypothetical protein